MKLLGVADLTRAQVVPEVPTIAESGLPAFNSITWFGLVAPPATPDAIAGKINRDVVEIFHRQMSAPCCTTLARAGRDIPWRDRNILCRGNSLVEQGDQRSGYPVAVIMARLNVLN